MIFSEELIKKAPFATNFFEKALNSTNTHFANGFILSGNNISLQYELVLEIAKHLNCQNKTENCTCTNCSWIKKNAHPAIITISPIDYTEKNQKTISVSQIRTLKNLLGVSSPYHRIIIFTDATEATSTPFHNPPFKENRTNWAPEPLNKKVFGASPSNALLKTIEEPEGEVSFFFLTKNKNDLLSTIVSRCQCINIPSPIQEDDDIEIIRPIAQKLPFQTIDDCFLGLEMFETLLKDNPAELLLNKIENHLKKSLEANITNYQATRYLLDTINKIETTKNQLRNFVREQNAIESLFFSLKN